MTRYLTDTDGADKRNTLPCLGTLMFCLLLAFVPALKIRAEAEASENIQEDGRIIMEEEDVVSFTMTVDEYETTQTQVFVPERTGRYRIVVNQTDLSKIRQGTVPCLANVINQKV